MMQSTLNSSIRWTEKELIEDIGNIEQQLIDDTTNGEEAGCARAYLRQVLKDRRATLRLLRFRNKQAKPEVKETRVPNLTWPVPRPVNEFRPLLQV